MCINYENIDNNLEVIDFSGNCNFVEFEFLHKIILDNEFNFKKLIVKDLNL